VVTNLNEKLKRGVGRMQKKCLDYRILVFTIEAYINTPIKAQKAYFPLALSITSTPPKTGLLFKDLSQLSS
jgi:hypothetical protein